ncbi:MAG: hypothetical protein ACJ754_01900 [Pyrinomonadaceae bacterium]
MCQLNIAYAVLLGATLCVAASAQGGSGSKRKGGGAKPRAGSTRETPTLEQQYALAVLEQLLSTSKGFEDDQLRIKTQVQAADILWPYDEPRARGIFKDAFDATASAKLEKGKEGTAPASPPGGAAALMALRGEVLSVVARRDPDLAENLIGSLKGARGEDDATNPDNAGVGPGLYLESALSIAETNPRRAVRLAEAGLEGGLYLDPSLVRVLYALRRTSPAQADALYKSVLAAARRRQGYSAVNLTILAAYALPEFSTGTAYGGDTLPNTGTETQAAGPLAVEFLDFAFDTYTSLAFPPPAAATGAEARPASVPNPIDYITGQRLLPFFTRYLPEKAVLFRGALEAIAVRLKQNSLMETVSNLAQSGSTDDIAKQAEAAKDSFQRDLLYFRATLSASGAGEFERALSLAEKISAEDFRDELESTVRFSASTNLLGKGEIDASLGYAKEISDVRRRALLLAKIARALLDRQNIPRASEILSEAEKTIDRGKDGMEKAQALLMITEVKIRLDPTQGFESMEATVKAFNEADTAPAPKSDAAPGIGSMMKTMLASMFRLGSPDFAPSFSLLAANDFNRAVQLAQKLTRKDGAVLAQLAACRGVLIKQTGKKSQPRRS